MINVIVPIRSFDGMTRLAGVLDAEARSILSVTLAKIVVDAATRRGVVVHVLSDDAKVRSWAHDRGAAVLDDNGNGLSGAVTAAVASVGQPWVVVHADLPLVDREIFDTVFASVDAGRSVLAPSIDGGTNLIASRAPIRFAYGPDSFTRHFALMPSAEVITDRRLALEVDTQQHHRELLALGVDLSTTLPS